MDPDSKASDQQESQGGDNSDNENSSQLSKAHENAADLVRHKIDELYAEEPDAKEEAVDAIDAATPRSKHQQYMYDLSRSGQSLAQIQQAWHDYYNNLNDKEKHEVWQEFYAQNKPEDGKPQVVHIEHEVESTDKPKRGAKNPHKKRVEPRSVGEIKSKILNSASANKRLKAKHHIQSMIFGLSMGALVVLILLFGFFNERFIAPFITPSRQVSSTPIIIDSSSSKATGPPKIIIPKINVEIPVVYDVKTIEEQAVEKGLERGVVHYATTPSPGEQGNAVIFGHSSNNIFNPGKYKFAFVLLSRLENGDIFYLTKGGTRYAYKVYRKKIVEPTDVSVLGGAGKKASATLITCDPPGTSLHRLIVTGEQISPNPSGNSNSTAINQTSEPQTLPSNAPSLWSRLFNWLSR